MSEVYAPARAPQPAGAGAGTSAAPPEDAVSPDMEVLVPRFWGLVLPAAISAVTKYGPSIGSVIGGAMGGKSGAKTGSKIGGVVGGLGGLFGGRAMPDGAMDGFEVELEVSRLLQEQHLLTEVVTDILQQATPEIIQAMQQEVQDRASRGLPTDVVDDEALERGWGFLASLVTEQVIKYAPGAIKKATKSLGAIIGSRDVDAFTPLLVDTETTERFVLPSMSSILSAVQSCMPQLYELVANPTREMPRTTGIGWNDLMESKRMWDNDNIAIASVEPIEDQDSSEFVLELAPHKTWWKGLQVQNGFGAVVAEISVGDDDKVASMKVPSQSLLDGGSLVFMKANIYGLHTGVYRLPAQGLEQQLRGQRNQFYWYAD